MVSVMNSGLTQVSTIVCKSDSYLILKSALHQVTLANYSGDLCQPTEGKVIFVVRLMKVEAILRDKSGGGKIHCNGQCGEGRVIFVVRLMKVKAILRDKSDGGRVIPHHQCDEGSITIITVVKGSIIVVSLMKIRSSSS